METPEATYRINLSTLPPGAKCRCTHTISAHGSNGLICCVCGCLQFEPPEPKS